ncbi:MAG: preprotein translocase subunit YajC [Tissierellia bacterium]|nr:preprotein translocase subunit YajC [Tissierellia bacterium]
MNSILLAAQATPQQGGLPIGILYILMLGLGFYFLILKPQKKQQKAMQNMMEELKVGDDIVTKSGVSGTVLEIDDVYFTIETGNNGTQIKYLKYALSYIVKPVPGYEHFEEQEEEFVDENSVPTTEEELFIEQEKERRL